MPIRQRLSLLTIALLVSIPAVPQAAGKASPQEVTLLPRYCWGYYNASLRNNPAFLIPNGCGSAMNHFCGGIVEFNRAQTARSIQERVTKLRLARQSFRYTQSSYRNPRFRGCPIRADVESYLMKAEGQLLGLGAN